jgi:hypothetical protein
MSWKKISLALCVTSLALVLNPVTSFANTTWWHQGWSYRSPIQLPSASHADSLIKVPLNLKTLQQQLNLSSTIHPQSLRVIDQSSSNILTSQITSTNTSTGETELQFYVPNQLTNSLPYLYFDTHQGALPLPQIPVLVTHQTEPNYQGQEALMIETPRSTYAFHTKAGGLASLIDNQEKDWISFNRTAGSAGMYRGLPNLVHPGNIFHPGYTFATTTITKSGPLYLELKSTGEQGAWETIWYFYPTFTHLKVTKTPSGAKYWFLYEGTPGGSISASSAAMDTYTLSNGTKYDITTTKEGDLPDPEWLYFQDPTLNRSLFLLHHQADTHPDRYFLMDKNMTVFGFGRGTGTTKYLTGAQSFTFGLVETKQHAAVTQTVSAHLNQPTGQLGAVQQNANSTPIVSPTATALPADFNGDGKVNLADLMLFIPQFNSTLAKFNLNKTGKVDIFDFNLVIASMLHK